MRPVDNPRDMTMLHRIEVQVVGVASKVMLIGNAVLPEPTLPDAAFSLENPARGQVLAGLDACREA